MEDTTRPESNGGTAAVPHASENGRYAFGPFVLDPVKRTLCREDRSVPITAKTFDVLMVLLEHRDRVVGKDELLSLVWPATAVQENNLVRQISSLRRALGERPDQHDYIVTIPGSGYRFVGGVTPITATTERHDHAPAHDSALAAPASPDKAGGGSPQRRTVTLFAAAGAITCGVVLTVLAITALRPGEARP